MLGLWSALVGRDDQRSKPKEIRMKFIVALSALAFVGFCQSKPVVAEPAPGKCSGVLRQVKGDLMFGGGKGEGEGICVINKLEVSKVLAVCHVGGRCFVEGMVDDCKELGECVELTKVKVIQKIDSNAD